MNNKPPIIIHLIDLEGMNRIKNNIKNGFTIIPNDLLNSEEIDPIAKFIFCYMAAKPDNFEFGHSHLMKVAGIKDPRTFRKYMDQLLTPGWLTRERTRGQSAKFSSYDYEINGQPVCKKCTLVEPEPVCIFSTVQKMHSAKNAHYNNKEDLIIKNKEKERENAPAKKPQRTKKFQPPTLEEMTSYFLEKIENESSARREAQKCWHSYDSKNWMVGKSKMQKWKSAAAGWILRMDDYKPKPQTNAANKATYGAAYQEDIIQLRAERRQRRRTTGS